jgi:hypothetical protein
MRWRCVALAVGWVTTAGAQTGEARNEVPALLARAEAQIWALEEAKAIVTLEQALAWSSGASDELSKIHLYFGLAYSGLANARKAIEHFRTARSLDPVIVLPPRASPRVVAWWDQAVPRPRVLTPLPSALSGTPDLATDVPAVSKPWPRWTSYSLAGLSVAAATASTLFGVAALNADRAARAPDVDAVTARPLFAQAQGHALVANVLWSVTASLVLGTAATYLLSSPTP